jgi:pyrroline-5-carboxylate reductase
MKVGFIGAGRMGSALVKSFLDAGALKARDIVASDKDEGKLRALAGFGVATTSDNREVAKKADAIFLAVKPGEISKVLDEIKDPVGEKLIVSIAAGIPTKLIEGKLGSKVRVVRVMPNMPCAVGEGVTVYCLGKNASRKDEEVVKKLFGSVGIAIELKEGLIDAATGLSGSGPAYFYLIIKALTDAGVKEGLPKNVAEKLAAQTAKGAGAMVLRSDKTPDELIDMVRSPGGTTAEGLKAMEERKVAEAMIEAVKAATKKARELER